MRQYHIENGFIVTFPYKHFFIESASKSAQDETVMELGNLLILQSGTPSVMGNSILYGALTEALNHEEEIKEIYGGYHGFEGISSQPFTDLASLSQKKANRLLFTAPAALGHESDEFHPSDKDFQAMASVLSQNNIRCLAVIGDQKSIQYTQQLLQVAQKAGYALNAMVVPQSNNNEIPMTDHSLGYGSTIKGLNSLMVSFKHVLTSESIPVGICEIEDHISSWVLAGSALLSANTDKNNNEPTSSYLVCLPEQPFNPTEFIRILNSKLQHHSPVLIMTHSPLINEEGNPLDIHAMGSVGLYLEQLIQSELNVMTCVNFCNLHLQPLSHFLSKQDQREAIACGTEAIQALIRGESGKATILVRNGKNTDPCEIQLLPLSELATGIKFFPSDWISHNTMTLQYTMVKYATPLIQGEVPVVFENGIPQFVHL